MELRHLLIAICFGLGFLAFDILPLHHSDVWGHVAYGEWILEQRGFPAEGPFVSLARGTPVVASAWLSQVLLALVERAGGAEWISHLFALASLAICAFLWRTFQLQTGRGLLALGGVTIESFASLAEAGANGVAAISLFQGQGSVARAVLAADEVWPEEVPR